jgi:hypothetical protein
MKSLKAKTASVFVAILLLSSQQVFISAQSSSNYRVDESAFSSGSEFDASSASYDASATAGLSAVGEASSTNFDIVAGLITPDVPFLEFYVTGAVVDLGLLEAGITASGSAQAGSCACSFSVRSYLSSSYTVTTIGTPPASNGGSILTAKSTQGAPSNDQGVEEFGMNVVANTLPSVMGANPSNQPDDGFADGIAATGYELANQYKYNPGDIIARAAGTPNTKAWGQTDYTVTYIARIKATTPSGYYTMKNILVATSTY